MKMFSIKDKTQVLIGKGIKSVEEITDDNRVS